MFYHTHIYVCITKTEIFDKKCVFYGCFPCSSFNTYFFQEILSFDRNAVVESVFVREINTFFF